MREHRHRAAELARARREHGARHGADVPGHARYMSDHRALGGAATALAVRQQAKAR
jgi:hypothetical protein